jgi:abortive infection Abi-like protein
MPRLKHTETVTLEEAFNSGQGAGYVLDFSDRTFALFFDEEFGIDIDLEKYRANGNSKGKRLRTFLSVEDGATAARVLVALWDHRAAILARQGGEDDPNLTDRYFQIVHQLQGDADKPSIDAIDRFVRDETLDELVAAIQRDIGANKPQAALDRVHTYCMKKFGHLIELHGGSYEKEDPLHNRAGKYIKLLESQGQMQPISVRIMKSSISIFDEFNSIRNNKPFAHDNELVGLHEARFIFDSISSVLRFIRSVEAARFGG